MSGEKHGTAPTAGEPRPPPDERRMPAAGPHATPELTNKDATPGAGSLPTEADTGDDAGTG